MTAKRFTFHHDVDGVDYIEDENNGFCLICDELMCSLLNELHEENQKLKKENAELEKFRYSIFKRMGELYEEQ